MQKYKEKIVLANPYPGHENRKKARKELLRIFHYRLNNIITIANDLDKERVRRESENKEFTVINNLDLQGLTNQLLISCNDMFDIFETLTQSNRVLELSSTVYEDGVINNMCKEILDDIYRHIGYTRKVKKDEQPVKQISA